MTPSMETAGWLPTTTTRTVRTEVARRTQKARRQSRAGVEAKCKPKCSALPDCRNDFDAFQRVHHVRRDRHRDGRPGEE